MKYSIELYVLNGVYADLDQTSVYTLVVSEGDSIGELLDNATVGVEDWYGNELPSVSLGDLTAKQFARVEKAILAAVEKEVA